MAAAETIFISTLIGVLFHDHDGLWGEIIHVRRRTLSPTTWDLLKPSLPDQLLPRCLDWSMIVGPRSRALRETLSTLESEL